METWFGPLPVAYRRIASAHLERDRKRHFILSDEKSPPSSTSLISEDKLSDSHQLLSLAPDEEKRARDLIIGGTSWSNPLQAALGEEQRCYIYERNYAESTLSDDTDSNISNSDATSQDWPSDGGSRVDIHVQPELYSQEIENQEDRISEYSDEITQEEPNSSPSQMPTTPTDTPEQFRDEQRSQDMDTLIEAKEMSQNNDAHENGVHQVESPSIPSESLGKRSDGESGQGRVAKRQRTSEGSSQERGKLVERVVRMPKEEVLLLSDLLLSMFRHDPKERIDIDAVVNHEYWGDRRNHWPINNEDPGEEIPDPISSRTRSRVSKAQQQAEPGSP